MPAIKAVKNDGTNIVLEESVVEAFETVLRGDLIKEGSPNYDEVRQVWNGLIDRRPALIVRCSGVADIIEAVNFVAAYKLLLSIRGGGHNVAGSAVCDGGIVIDLSLMKGIFVDPQKHTARAQGGVTWAELDRETQVFGLATPGGVVSTTGIAGLTLGGGIGHLRSKYGMSCDNLLSVDLITADGNFLTASETENSDLFWALRGGGGNFGVVTSFEFQLHPVGPTVFLCAPWYPAEIAGDVIRFWRDFCKTAPDELSTSAVFWSIPPAPDIPEEMHGKDIIIPMGAFCGPVEEGENIVKPLRELSTPLVDMSGPVPYTALQTAFDAFFPKGELLYYFKSLQLNTLDDEVIEAIAARAIHRPSLKTLVPIWYLGGAMSRVGATETAFGDRSSLFLLSIDTVWDNPKDTEENLFWARQFWADIKSYSSGAIYINFPGFGEEREDLVRAAYGANYDRLTALKKKYDPDNLFRVNQNIKPAT